MKSNTKWIITAALAGLLAATTWAMAAYEPVIPDVSNEYYGSSAALNDDDYTLEEMLTYAIEDEYTARAEYEVIMDKYGAIRPFTNISRAESEHISLLTPLFAEYGLTVPENEAASHVTVPATLNESYAAGVEAEVKNIAMYERFLDENLPDDVRTVFENLQAASENHLQAFERSADRTAGWR